MYSKLVLGSLMLLATSSVFVVTPCACKGAGGGGTQSSPAYKVLAPIRHGNLTIFPVAAADSHDTSEFITLDEGIRSGAVEVTESGNPGLVRGSARLQPGGAQVNSLMLVNNSTHPLILLAGEIVTGGKQDRVIAKDRIVPAESDPIDLGVFCVEPGRWTSASAKFGSMSSAMAAPGVRSKAMAAKNQGMVWSEVRRAQEQAVAAAPAPARGSLASTSSYAAVMQNKEVQSRVDSVAQPVRRDYESLIKQLRDRHAVGVVVALNGEIGWADLFASTSLLEKYWPKLVRSYAAQAVISNFRDTEPSQAQAQAQGFVDDLEGGHVTTETEPGVYRHTEISGDQFKAFELTSLLPKTGFQVHIAKMLD